MISMDFNHKCNNAHGRDPDFGAIFMSNSATKRECFQRKLFGLPSSQIQFVEQVKAGMILFLFEYEKRQLHGVFKASCDGAMNIVPNAFCSSGKQFPAQVKFIPIWFCKPLPESLFHDAIGENYFSANKFNFGLSENQVYKLLYLFSKRKLELEIPGRQLTRMKDLKSEWYPVGKVGRFADHEMHAVTAKNEQPTWMHKYNEDPLRYNGKVENIGFNASDIAVNKAGRAAELALNTTSGYVDDYFALNNERGFTAHDKEHHMDIHLRPMISDVYSRSPSDIIRVHGDGRLSMSDRLTSDDLGKTNQRMIIRYDSPGLHHSNVNPSPFYRKPILEHDSLVQNQLRPTSAILHPIEAQISNTSCATQQDATSKSTLRFDPNASGFNFSQSSVRINNGSKSMLESASPSNKSGRNSLINQPCLMHTKMINHNRCHGDCHGLQDPEMYDSNSACMPFNAAWNSDQLAAESVAYEAGNSVPFLKSSSAPPPPSDIGNIGRVHEPFSCLSHNYNSYVGNGVHPTTLQEYLGHEMTLQKKTETCTPVVPWENEGHSLVQCGDPLVHECDIEWFGKSQSNNSGYRKKKSSVFSRLSFMQDVNKQENVNSTWNGDHDFHTSVDDVMEMVRQSHNQWRTKRKIKPLVKHNNAESLSDKTQTFGSRLKNDCFEKTWENVSMDFTSASGGNTDETAEDTCFVNFKRRSKVRKINDETKISNSGEGERSENSVFVQQKRRKLIRPNFSKSTSSDDKGMDLGASQNLQVPLSNVSYSPKDVSESCRALVQTEQNIKTDAEAQNFVGHSEDKRRRKRKRTTSPARGCVHTEGRGKARDVADTVVNDESECLENLNNQSTFSSASCEEKSCHNKEGLYTKDSIKSVSLDTKSWHSICQEDHVETVICQEHLVDKVICAGRGINTEEGISKDGGFSFPVEVKDGSDHLQNSGNENVPSATSCD